MTFYSTIVALRVVATTQAGADGTYTQSLVPGTYDVCFSAGAAAGALDGYVPQCYQGYSDGTLTAGYFLATPVQVSSGGQVTINASLQAGGAVSGRASDADGNSLPGLQVLVISNTTDAYTAGTTTTGPDGSFDIPNLAPGNYFVCFNSYMLTTSDSDYGLSDQCAPGVVWNLSYPPTSGQPSLSISANVTTTFNTVLSTGGDISGTVTDSSAQPLQGIVVYAVTADGPFTVSQTTTGTNGQYNFSDLAEGQYNVCFAAQGATGGSSTSGYFSQCYQGFAWDGSQTDYTPSTVVNVSSQTTTPDIDVQLLASAAVTGTVTDTSGVPLQGLSVTLYQTNGVQSVGTTTGANGTYKITGVPADNYYVCFNGPDLASYSLPTGYVQACYNSAGAVLWNGSPTTFEGLTTVDVVQGQTVALSTNQLQLAGAVEVSLVGTDEPFNATAYTATQPELVKDIDTYSTNGYFDIYGLPPGSYYICSSLIDQPTVRNCYEQPGSSSRTAVPVTAGQTTTIEEQWP